MPITLTKNNHDSFLHWDKVTLKKEKSYLAWIINEITTWGLAQFNMYRYIFIQINFNGSANVDKKTIPFLRVYFGEHAIFQ